MPAPSAYQVYFGNLHSHTGFSDGARVPDSAFDCARDTAGLDFLAVTDHAYLLDNGLAWGRSLEWRDLKLSADRKTVNGSFVAIAGSEVTWYPPDGFGHINTFAMDHFLNTYETKYNDAAHFYDSVKQYPASIVRWNHAIEVYTESGQLAGSASFDSNDVAWTGFQIDPNTKKYYFLKVIQSDGQYAITAPIWTGA